MAQELTHGTQGNLRQWEPGRDRSGIQNNPGALKLAEEL